MSASSSSSSSSSSSCSANVSYDVFLSFRGADTRYNFTSHLYDALYAKNVKAFIDDEGLERGHEISQALKEAIERSKLSIVVFSKDYASSSWCLDELVHILSCRERNNQIVVPVFYEIDPSDVRKQKGSFETAFAKHKHRHGDRKVNQWREALKTAAGLAGWDSQVIRSECELVKKIVEDISKKLNHISTANVFTGLVGIDKRIGKIEKMLCIGSSQIRTIGIWGTGGIGKTTLARIVFHRHSSKFEACCFLEDLRIDREDGQIKYCSSNSFFDLRRFHNKRAMIVLDNVNDLDQLELLKESFNGFGPGSRVIITTRDMQMIRGEADETYKVEKLDFEEALQLFSSDALKKTRPPDKYLQETLERIIYYAEGIPLALRVLSSFFGGKRHENWEAELNKMKQLPNKKILSILRTSYDRLDKMQKNIFLDIACFFKDMFRDDVETILDACGLHPKAGIDDLIDKSLISVKLDNKLWVHDLIQQMAWDIAKPTEELEKCSRIWLPPDACRILETRTVGRRLEGIFLDMSKIGRVNFNPAAFEEMYNLRLVKIYQSDVRKQCEVSANQDSLGPLFLPDSLRYLHWQEYPWNFFPPRYSPQNLVELNLPCSQVMQLWEGTQPLENLKKIDLSGSKNLTKLPDLSQALNLEHIYLSGCTGLSEFPSSIEHLGKLKTLILCGSSSIRKFPKLPKSIVCFILYGTSIERIPASIRYLDCLELLYIVDCRFFRLPSFSVMRSLKFIRLQMSTIAIPLWIYRVLERGEGFSNSFNGSGFNAPYSAYRNIELETVSISKTNVLQYLTRTGHQSRNLLLFNSLGFCGGGKIATFEREIHLLTKKVKMLEVEREFSIEADIGIGVQGNEMPEWFHYQCNNGNKVVVSFEEKENRIDILGFAACAIVQLPRNYVYEEFKLICQIAHTCTSIFGHGKCNCWCKVDTSKLHHARQLFQVDVASFEFWCTDQDYNELTDIKVQKCGIHIVFDERKDSRFNYGHEEV